MSLEAAIQELTEEVRELRTALSAMAGSVPPAPPKTDSVEVQEEPVKEKPAPKEKPKQEEAVEETAVTKAGVKSAFIKLVDVRGREAMERVLGAFDAEKLSDLAEEEYPKVMEAIQVRLEEEVD